MPQGRLIQSYSAHGYEVLSLSVAQDNERFVSAGGDRTVFLWDVATAATIRRFGGNQYGHSSRINHVTFAGESDNLVVSGGFDTSVRLWDVKSNSFKPIQVLDEARDAITCLAVRGPEVLTGSVDGRVRTYDVRMGQCTTDVIGASVTSLSLTRDGQAMLVGSLDNKLRLLDRQNGGCLRAFSDSDWRNEELRMQSIFGGQEKYVLVGDEMKANQKSDGQGQVWVWDTLTGKVASKLTIPWGPPGHEGKKLAVGRDGKTKPRTNAVSCMAWRDDGWGDQFCVAGTSGVVTVFGSL